MPPDNQEMPPRQGAEQAMAEQVRREMASVTDAASLLAKLGEIQAEGEMAFEGVRERAERKETGQDPDAMDKGIPGSIDDDTSLRHKVKLVQLHMKEMVRMMRENPDLMPAADSVGGKIVRAIVEAPELQAGPYASPYLYKIFRKAYAGQISNPLEALTSQELRYLRLSDQALANKIGNILVTEARAVGRTAQEIEAFEQETTTRVTAPRERRANGEAHREDQEEDVNQRVQDALMGRGVRGGGEGGSVAEIEQLDDRDPIQRARKLEIKKRQNSAAYYLSDNLFQTEQQIEVAWGLSSAERLLSFIKDIQTREEADLRRRKSLNSDIALSREQEETLKENISERLEQEIVEFYHQIYVPIDEANKEEPFDREAQKDYYLGFGTILTRFDATLGNLPNYINQLQPRERQRYGDILNMDFFGRQTQKGDEERVYQVMVDGREEERRMVVERIIPHAEKAPLNLPDFIRYLKVVLTAERELRHVTHDVQVLINQPPDSREGFFTRLNGYVSKLKMETIDELVRLPDSHIFATAYGLYHKYLEATFAKYDWRHEPYILGKVHGFLNQVEKDVLEELKIIFPEIHNQNGLEGSGEWRLRRANSLAVGSSVGIFLNELELASLADGAFDAHGQPTDIDYYRNGAHAINALNPMQQMYRRWLKEHREIAGIVFIPVGREKHDKWWKKRSKWWNHLDVYNEMKKNMASYEQRDLKPLKDGRIRLIDIMNFGKIGGLHTRSGWRTLNAYKDWIVRQRIGPSEEYPAGQITDRINYAETWKSLENIGFEAVWNFTAQIDQEGFFESDNPQVVADRRALFKHLYQRYTNPGATDSEFDSYFIKLESNAKKKIKMSEVHNLGDRPWRSQEVYRFEIHRALGGLLKERMPGKFLRMERGRLVEGGLEKRLWNSIRREMGLENKPLEIWDQTVRDMATAESLLRKRVSETMMKWIENPNNKDKKLNECPVNYKLTVDQIDDLFDGVAMNNKDVRINYLKQALGILDRKLDRSYLDNFAVKLEQKYLDAHYAAPTTNEFAFAIAPEELEMRFVSWAGGGTGVLGRSYGEAAETEEKIVKVLFQEWAHLLQEIATNGKQDFSPLIEKMREMHFTMKDAITIPYANQMMGYLATATVKYFLKDSAARSVPFFLKPFRFFRHNSIAAEFAGTNRGIWEWDTSDADKFATKLEQLNIVAKDPYEKHKVEIDYLIDRKVNLPFIGERHIQLLPRANRGYHFRYSGKEMRREMGATWTHKIWEIVNKWIPLVLGAIIVTNLIRAAKDAEEEKH